MNSPAIDLNLWLGRPVATQHSDKSFLAMTRALTDVLEAVAGSRPSMDTSQAVHEHLRAVRRLLVGSEVDESLQLYGRQLASACRGQVGIPELTVDRYDDHSLSGRTVFGRRHLGSNGAAHGGAIALLFDDLLGQLANPPSGVRARTASLRIDYRRVVPISTELAVTAEVVSVLGRKVTIVGEVLSSSGDVLTRASGLFVRLHPGQP